MKTLYFIRHGETEFNKSKNWSGSTDVPLTKKGHEQAKKAGQAVKESGLSFDIIISSPLQRAHDTAKHVARAINYPEDKIVVHELFTERSFGKLEGRKDITAVARFIKGGEAAIDQYEGVESLEQLHKRAEEFYKYLQELEHENILVVGHGAIGRALRRTTTGEPMHVMGKRYGNAELVRLV